MDINTSKNIVNDYIQYKLTQKGFECKNSLSLPLINEVHLTMRWLGDKFEERDSYQVLNEMCNSLHLTPNSVYSTLEEVANELFEEGIRWGRIAALLIFGGMLAIECMNKEMPDLVRRIFNWITTYIDTNLLNWIRGHNGWDGFVEFYRRKEPTWSTMKNFLCGIAITAVVVITVTALLSNR